MEKIIFICVAKGSSVKNVNGTEVIIHSVDFAIKKEKSSQTQKLFGGLHLESSEQLHYKVKKEYSLLLSEALIVSNAVDIRNLKSVSVN